MKRYFKFIVVIVVLLNITANMANALLQAPSENKIQTQEIDRLQKIKEKGILTVLSANYAPQSYKDPKTGILSGIDVDIMQEVAKRLGVKEVRAKYVSFSSLLESLNTNPDIDLVLQGMFPTDERKKLVNFTNPVYSDNDAILTLKDTGINSKADLKNATIGTVGGTLFEDKASEWRNKGLIKDYRTFYNNNSLEIVLKDKMVEAVLIDFVSAQNIFIKNPNGNFKLLTPTQYKPEINLNIAYALKKEDTTLLNAINEKLQEMKEDGTLYEILGRYGLTGNYVP